MLTYLNFVEYLICLDILFFLTLSLSWPFKTTSLPKTLLTLPALSFHKQLFPGFIPRDGMGRKTQRIESPENTTANSYLRLGFWVQKQGIPFISTHPWHPLTCIPYNHLSVAMVQMKLSVVSGLSVSALTITKNTDGHCCYSHSLCVPVHLMEPGTRLWDSTHIILTTTKAAGAAITRWNTKSFRNFCLPVTKIHEFLHQGQRVQ